jgi:integrase
VANPAVLVDMSRQGRDALETSHLNRREPLLNRIRSIPEAPVAPVLTAGMRPNEHLVLTWNDLDLDYATARISRTLEWREGMTVRGQQAVKKLLLRERISKDLGGRRENLIPCPARRPTPRIELRAEPFPARAQIGWFACHPARRPAPHGADHFIGRWGFLENHQRGTRTSQRNFVLDVYRHVLSHMQDAATEKVHALI